MVARSGLDEVASKRLDMSGPRAAVRGSPARENRHVSDLFFPRWTGVGGTRQRSSLYL